MAIPVHVLPIDAVRGENGATSSEAPAPNSDFAPPLGDAGRLGRKWQPGDVRRSSSSDTLGAALARKDQSVKGSSLPKFGEWDVNDPASGVGFTAIFEKVMDEKKTGRAALFSSKSAASLLPTIKFTGSSQKPGQASLLKNWCCCCFRHQKG